MPCAVQAVTVQQPAHKDVGMRIRRVDIQDTGNTRTGSGRTQAAPAGDREPVSGVSKCDLQPELELPRCVGLAGYRAELRRCHRAVRRGELRSVEQVVTLRPELWNDHVIRNRERELLGQDDIDVAREVRSDIRRPRADVAKGERSGGTEYTRVEPAADGRVYRSSRFVRYSGREFDRDRLPALHAHDAAEVPPAQNIIAETAKIHRSAFADGQLVNPAADELVRRVEGGKRPDSAAGCRHRSVYSNHRSPSTRCTRAGT